MLVVPKSRVKKFVSDSAIIGERIELLHEMSSSGLFLGSRILEIVEKVAMKCANLHADQNCLLHGVDFVRFLSPAKKEDILVCSASVNRAWFFSMEVGVKVVVEDFRSLEQKEMLFAYYTFNLVDEAGKPLPILVPQTEAEKRRYIEAEKRRKLHFINRKKYNSFLGV